MNGFSPLTLHVYPCTLDGLLQRTPAAELRNDQLMGQEHLQKVSEEGAGHDGREEIPIEELVDLVLEVLGSQPARLPRTVGGVLPGEAREHRGAEAAARDAADRKHVLGKVRAAILQPGQNLGGELCRVEPAALGRDQVDRIRLVLIGVLVLALAVPIQQGVLHLDEALALDGGVHERSTMGNAAIEQRQSDNPRQQHEDPRYAPIGPTMTAGR